MTTKPTGIVARLTKQLEEEQSARAAIDLVLKGIHRDIEKAEAETKATNARWQKRWDDTDPEAIALAYCVRAIEAMRHPKGTSNTSINYGYGYRPQYDANTGERYPEPKPPPLGSTDVGRILLHLADRYGIDLRGES